MVLLARVEEGEAAALGRGGAQLVRAAPAAGLPAQHGLQLQLSAAAPHLVLGVGAASVVLSAGPHCAARSQQQSPRPWQSSSHQQSPSEPEPHLASQLPASEHVSPGPVTCREIHSCTDKLMM